MRVGPWGGRGKGGSYLSRCSSCLRLQADHVRPPWAGLAPSTPITWPLGPQPLPDAPSCSRPKLRGGGGAEGVDSSAGPPSGHSTRQVFRPTFQTPVFWSTPGLSPPLANSGASGTIALPQFPACGSRIFWQINVKKLEKCAGLTNAWCCKSGEDGAPGPWGVLAGITFLICPSPPHARGKLMD